MKFLEALDHLQDKNVLFMYRANEPTILVKWSKNKFLNFETGEEVKISKQDLFADDWKMGTSYGAELCGLKSSPEVDYWRTKCRELEEELAKMNEYCQHLEDERDEAEGCVWDLMGDNKESRIDRLEKALKVVSRYLMPRNREAANKINALLSSQDSKKGY